MTAPHPITLVTRALLESRVETLLDTSYVLEAEYAREGPIRAAAREGALARYNAARAELDALLDVLLTERDVLAAELACVQLHRAKAT